MFNEANKAPYISLGILSSTPRQLAPGTQTPHWRAYRRVRHPPPPHPSPPLRYARQFCHTLPIDVRRATQGAGTRHGPFKSTTGTTGTLNMATGAWQFTSPIITATPTPVTPEAVAAVPAAAP